MPQSFIACDRKQGFLLPPSLLDWVPEDHVVWTILGAVGELDLSALYGAHRADGRGRPAYDPAMMVALLPCAYARGNRSSRGIERECREDVAYRVICASLVPDHSTIAEFRRRHGAAVGDLFGSVLWLCERAGLVTVGVIAIDATKIAADASMDANRGYERIVREILDEAAEADRVEDELCGEARGDELPERLRRREGRRAALREARGTLEAEREATRNADEAAGDDDRIVAFDLGRERAASSERGRRGWLRDARRQLDEPRHSEARPIRALTRRASAGGQAPA
jgi:transposase